VADVPAVGAVVDAAPWLRELLAELAAVPGLEQPVRAAFGDGGLERTIARQLHAMGLLS
jgi:hypothetical protein